VRDFSSPPATALVVFSNGLRSIRPRSTAYLSASFQLDRQRLAATGASMAYLMSASVMRFVLSADSWTLPSSALPLAT